MNNEFANVQSRKKISILKSNLKQCEFSHVNSLVNFGLFSDPEYQRMLYIRPFKTNMKSN